MQICIGTAINYFWIEIELNFNENSIKAFNQPSIRNCYTLSHWGRVTHICFSKLIIIGSDNGLSPGWRETIIWANAEILLIGPLGINFSEILIKIHIFSFKKMHMKMLSGKCQPICLSLNVLADHLALPAADCHLALLGPWPTPCSTQCSFRNLEAILKMPFSILLYWLVSSGLLIMIPTIWMLWDINDVNIGSGNGSVQQAITWANVDPDVTTRPQWVNLTHTINQQKLSRCGISWLTIGLLS